MSSALQAYKKENEGLYLQRQSGLCSQWLSPLPGEPVSEHLHPWMRAAEMGGCSAASLNDERLLNSAVNTNWVIDWCESSPIPVHFLTKVPVRIRINPARHTSSTPNSTSTALMVLSNSARLPYSLWSTTCEVQTNTLTNGKHKNHLSDQTYPCLDASQRCPLQALNSRSIGDDRHNLCRAGRMLGLVYQCLQVGACDHKKDISSCANNVQLEKQDTHLFQISVHQLWSSCEVYCCSGWRPSHHSMQVLLSGGCALGFAPPQVLPLQFLNKSFSPTVGFAALHIKVLLKWHKAHAFSDQYAFISHQAAYGPVIRRPRLPSSLHEVGGGPSEHWWATPPALPPGHSWRCGSSPPRSVLPPCRAKKTQKGCSTEMHLSRRANVSKVELQDGKSITLVTYINSQFLGEHPWDVL